MYVDYGRYKQVFSNQNFANARMTDTEVINRENGSVAASYTLTVHLIF